MENDNRPGAYRIIIWSVLTLAIKEYIFFAILFCVLYMYKHPPVKMNSSKEKHIQREEQDMKKSFVIAGALMMVAGIVSLVFPLVSVLTMGKLFGAAILVWGAGSLAVCIMDQKSFGKGLVCALAALAGLLILLDAFTTLAVVDVLVKVFAAFTLFSGITQMMVAATAKEGVSHRVLVLLTGILNVILAILVLANPFTGFMVADCLIAFELLMTGSLLISFGFVKPEMKINVEKTETAEA